MSPRVNHVRHVGDYRLELGFEDGLVSTVDFKDRVIARGGVWKPLHDVAYFAQVMINRDLETIVWPNGVDVCPDVLYALAAGKPLPEAGPANRAMAGR